MFKKGKIFIGIAVALLATISLSACGKSANASSDGDVGRIQKKGTLVVGIISSNPPYEFHTSINGKDKFRGSDVKLVKAISKKLGVKYQLKQMDVDGLLPALQAKKVDMLVTSLSPTPERKKAAEFSNVYYKSTAAITVRKTDFKKFNGNTKALSRATIAVVNSSTQEAMLQKMYPNATLKKFSKVTDLALAVANNKADAFCIDVPTTKLLLRQNPSLKQTNFNHDDGSVGAAVAMPKGTSENLIKKVNQVIKANKQQYSKWVIDETKYVQE
ncbi:polar amino acid ABC transporter amino acid-binding protein [Lacticaseibacillus pantheris DSM 15945 = JCM 12539 = NBRC 106106]|jgi:polar amino acid transport system substrate-binding protein|uniref:Polar amino acid ABC transporter amino acid-binding protein n=2 Tax=Lacticaseibacillus pantheris TaxID=171523 RepID=A0A0R1U0B0_9LACO|nr:transporter substrate-binding domain-containing protein [Lacticaseibacillus pantheris]KRL85924.1 polar amino acid ABC transporter amino acid-binding protein [Lacticaseibacillus pantheris DSM 15945 = JCM 12539 = NBRC 106106]